MLPPSFRQDSTSFRPTHLDSHRGHHRHRRCPIVIVLDVAQAGPELGPIGRWTFTGATTVSPLGVTVSPLGLTGVTTVSPPTDLSPGATTVSPLAVPPPDKCPWKRSLTA